MANACASCTAPVHEEVVVCPHCGQSSGATPHVLTAADAEALLAIEGVGKQYEVRDAKAALLELGSELVSAMIAAADSLREHDPPLPTAIAHVRTRPPAAIETVDGPGSPRAGSAGEGRSGSVEPEKIDPTDPSARPRFLK